MGKVETFLARQAILNDSHEIVAYELLHRSNKENNFSLLNNDQATLDVLNTFIEIGFDDLSGGRPCFINFTDHLLENEIPNYFHPEMIVIEILETVKFTDDLIDILRRLKTQGFKIALDDFELNDSLYLKTILNLVDIVKIDIQKTPQDQQIKIVKLLKKYNVELLAEKVETKEEYEKCLREGYKYFQGYFFSKPMILSINDFDIQNSNFFGIMGELSKPEPDFDKIVQNIERDVVFSFKLLKLINSPVFSRENKIKSIKQAIIMLGLKELKKWIYLMYIRETSDDINQIQNEIIKMCMTRAKASELIAIKIGKRGESSSYFLTGLFSLIDALLKQPLGKIINQLPLDKGIKDTLMGNHTSYRDVLDLVILFEKGEWGECPWLISKIGIDEQNLCEIFIHALKWAQEVFKEVEPLKENGETIEI
jgi:c-di-GMP-related signal transduction protein